MNITVSKSKIRDVMDDTTKKLKQKVKALLKKPQPEQRTEAWFKQRQTRITASEAASCLFKSKNVCEPYARAFNVTNFKYKDNEPLNPYETKENYIIKKCSAFFGESVFRDTVFTLWGKKYEEVANRLYAHLTNKKVYEFGLISHGRLKWLAASPDGITEDGIMLEIKCPKSRKIDITAPPLYYWIQTQIQLEVAGLQYCDFLECEIKELENEEEFINTELQDKQDKGILLQWPVIPESEPKFMYPPIGITTTDKYIEWKNDKVQENKDLTPTYFHITKYNVIRIERDTQWFANIRGDLKKTWEFITRLQNNEEDFIKYKESMEAIKNKDHIEKYNKTTCMINGTEQSLLFQFEAKGHINSDNDSAGTAKENNKKDCMICSE
jgi:putative phage-type endonuclease